MKAIFETEDPQEMRMLAKAQDMASFIFELVNNSWREWKETSYEYEKYLDKINAMLEEHGIDITDLIS